MAALAAFALPSAAFAAEIWSRGEASFSLGAELRQIVLYSKQTSTTDFESAIQADLLAGNTRCAVAAGFADCPAFDTVGQTDAGQGFTRIRIKAEARFTEWLYAVAIYDNEILYGIVDTLEAALGAEIRASSFSGAEGTLSRGAHHEWRHALYRGFLKLETERFELGVGRQRVAWGVGRLWTPIDRFSALPPLSLQPDVTPGIDGIDGRYNFDGFSYFQFVYAPGSSSREQRWALRLHGVLLDADLSLMGGMFEEAPTIGFDFARNLMDAAIRFEAVYTRPEHTVWKIGDAAPERLPEFWQVVASFDINLDLGTGLYVLVEYFYNGNALGFGAGLAGPLLPLFEATDVPPDPALAGIPGPYVKTASTDVFGSSRIISNSPHQTGMQLGYDITPELRGDLVTLIDMVGGSAAFFPNFRYSPLDSLELTFGVQLFAGPKLSQYGDAEPVVYLLADWFF